MEHVLGVLLNIEKEKLKGVHNHNYLCFLFIPLYTVKVNTPWQPNCTESSLLLPHLLSIPERVFFFPPGAAGNHQQSLLPAYWSRYQCEIKVQVWLVAHTGS